VKAIIAVLVLMLASSGPAFAQIETTSYHCVGEAAGGLKYNDTLKQWEGVSFHPSKKFVLKMKFLRDADFSETVGQMRDYAVTITKSDETTPQTTGVRTAHWSIFVCRF
jgi:hypothetical protein